LNGQPQSTTSALAGDVASIRQARDLTHRFLLDAEPAVSETTIEEAVLAVSEMVTNAVVHAPGACVLEISLDERSIQIGVTDTSATVPAARMSHLDGSGGFGLPLLHKLAAGMETALHATGKTVSIVLDRHPQDSERPNR
jgi:anti-sigma regulatory factor (Ser/Thr protein kinase)